MKQVIFMLATLLFTACKDHDGPGSPDFKAARISKTSTIRLKGNVEKIFPLFGAFEERKWADKWNPTLIYPAVERIEEGTTFKTPGHGHAEKRFLWIVSKYDLQAHLIQYLVSSENRYWTITIKCMPLTDSTTSAKITYAFTSLNNPGNEINDHFLKTIYHDDLEDWQQAINYYLETGKTLR